MTIGTILKYTLSSAIAALIAGGAWLTARLIRGSRAGGRFSRRDGLKLLAAAYLAAVAQIIGLRVGLVRPSPMSDPPRLIPLQTTLGQWRIGPWHFIYHTLGNLAWFVPLGLLLPRLTRRCRWYHALIAGALLSVAVEAMQFFLGTGTPDIDDVFLNALGALAGYGLSRWIRRLRQRRVS